VASNGIFSIHFIETSYTFIGFGQTKTFLHVLNQAIAHGNACYQKHLPVLVWPNPIFSIFIKNAAQICAKIVRVRLKFGLSLISRWMRLCTAISQTQFGGIAHPQKFRRKQVTQSCDFISPMKMPSKGAQGFEKLPGVDF
jgi:hypothetical protein